MGLFGKKKDESIRVLHYEGLKDFMQDSPCTVEVNENVFIIKRIKPETTVTLPMEKVLTFDAMEEPSFMIKYHNINVNTSKAKGINKYYLVVRYINKENEEKYLAFWGTASEYGKFLKLRTLKLDEQSKSYSL